MQCPLATGVPRVAVRLGKGLTSLTPYIPPSSPAPENNRTENGLQCPTCITHFKETCSSTKKVLCVGQESHCITCVGKVQTGEGHLDFWGRGQGGSQNWRLILPDSRGESGSRELGEEVAGALPRVMRREGLEVLTPG